MKYSISKVNVILILIVAIIVVAGFVSCTQSGTQDITGSYTQTGGGGITVNPDDNTPTLPTDTNDYTNTPSTPTNTPATNTNTNPPATNTPSIPSTPSTPSEDDGEIVPGANFYRSSYRTVYAPFTGSKNYYSVSYNDTNTLTKLWKAIVGRKQFSDGTRMYIKTRDGDLLFDEDYNVRWSKRPSVVLKWFKGGAIMQIKKGFEGANTPKNHDAQGGRMVGEYAIMGLYTYAYDLNTVKGWGSYASDVLNEFFGYYNGNTWFQYAGRMELLCLNTGLSLNVDTGTYYPYVNHHGYGLQMYYDWNGYMDDRGWAGNGYVDGRGDKIYSILGNTPERYIPHLIPNNIYGRGFRWAAKTYKGSDVK